MRCLSPTRLFVSALFLSSSLVAQEAPRIGLWVSGPRGSAHDLTADAVTKAQFAINDRLVSNDSSGDTAVYLGCKSTPPAKPILELRFSLLTPPGFNPAGVSKTAFLWLGGDKYPVSLEAIPIQNTVLFIVTPGATEAKGLGLVKHNATTSLSLNFQLSGRKASFITNLTEPVPAIRTVLEACGMNVPPPPLPPLTAAEMARTPAKYTFEGIHLGMTEPQVRAALKGAGSIQGLQDTGLGYFKATTPDATFDAIQMNDIGQVWSYSFSARNPKRLKSAKDSGPTYDLGVKAFGPPISKKDSGVVWAPENDRHVESAYYEWDASEEPGGRVLVTNGLQTTR